MWYHLENLKKVSHVEKGVCKKELCEAMITKDYLPLKNNHVTKVNFS